MGGAAVAGDFGGAGDESRRLKNAEIRATVDCPVIER